MLMPCDSSGVVLHVGAYTSLLHVRCFRSSVLAGEAIGAHVYAGAKEQQDGDSEVPDLPIGL